MVKDLAPPTGRLGMLAVILSTFLFLYWFCAMQFNIYQWIITGALFELLWLPMVILVGAWPPILAVLFIKKLMNYKHFLLSIAFCLGTICFIIFRSR